MKRVVHKALSFKDAEAWDRRQQRALTINERFLAVRELQRRVYGEVPDIRACHIGCASGRPKNLTVTPRTGRRLGLTLIEVLVIVGVVVLLALALYAWILPNVESAWATSMKGNGRGVRCAIVSANFERGTGGTNSVWPKALGFDSSRTSTEYFRRLMSDTNGCPARDPGAQLVSDLKPGTFHGPGVPRARTVEQFARRNNPWAVCCVNEDTPSDTLFMVTRNVDMGRTLSPASPMVLTKEKPFGRKRAVWITRGGGCFDTRPKYLTAARLFPSTNQTYDVMYP